MPSLAPASKRPSESNIISVTGTDGRVMSVMVRSNSTVSKASLRDAFLLQRDTAISLLSSGAFLDSDVDVYTLPSGWENLQFKINWDSCQIPVNIEQKWQLKENLRLYARNWLYTIPPSKDCVVVLSSNTAATYHHGTHKAYTENVTFDVSPLNPGEPITVAVAKIIPSFDLVLLRATNGKFPFPPCLMSPYPGMKFCVIGFGHHDQSNETYSYGSVFTETAQYYPDAEGSYVGPFWLGTAQMSPGDSGGACISSDGCLIGINVSKTCMPSTCHTAAISEAAIFAPKNAFIGGDILQYERLLLEKPADRKHQPCVSTQEIILPVLK